MSDLHQLSYHTFERTASTQRGAIYLSPARKAWKRRNELLVDPEPILLLDLGRWRLEREAEALEWSEATLSTLLAQHPSTRIHAPRIDWLAPLRTAARQTTALTHGVSQSLGSLSHATSSAIHATTRPISSGIHTTAQTVHAGATSLGRSSADALLFTANVPLSCAKVTSNAIIGSAAWCWGVGEATLNLLGELVPSRGTFATLTRWSSHLALSFSVALMLLFAGPVVILQTQDLLSKADFQLPKVQLPFQNQTDTATPLPSPSPSPLPEIGSAEDVFSISVPDLKIKSTITPNVDPGNEDEYTAALKKGIAHAAGTALPEQYDYTKTVYLFAHSTDAPWNIARYNAQFYALKDAQPGQEITVRFWGKDYRYTIESTEIIEATDVSHLQPQLDEPRLVLQTCYPPGTTWKRLLVIAKPAQNTP